MNRLKKISNRVKKNNQKFNIVISGTGGQGLITLVKILSEAALKEGYDVKTSELHGLSQRGGSVEVHIRFGDKIYSPLVKKGGADLIISLEAQESLRSYDYASKKTIFLVNNFFISIPGQKSPKIEEISNLIKKISQKVIFLPAVEICQKEFKTNVTAGIYLLSYASFKNLIPLKPNSILTAIKKIIPEKFLELNLKTFKLAKKIRN